MFTKFDSFSLGFSVVLCVPPTLSNHSSPPASPTCLSSFFFFSPLFQTRPLPLGIMCTEITVPKGNISRVTAALAIDDPLRISTNTRSVSEKFQIVISKPLVDCTKGRWGVGGGVGGGSSAVNCLNTVSDLPQHSSQLWQNYSAECEHAGRRMWKVPNVRCVITATCACVSVCEWMGY